MKQIVKLLTLMCRKAHLPAVMLLALLSGLAAHADVVINETTFPDANFRNFILSQTYGQDGVLTDTEIAEVDSIYCSKMQIESLEGIGFFSALVVLDCSGNNLTNLDLAGCVSLKSLKCSNNAVLTSVIVFENILLEHLTLNSNKLSTINLSNNTKLIELYIGDNQLIELDLSQNTQLTHLFCQKNQLTTLDLSKQTDLQELHCESNHLTELNLSATSFSLRSPRTLSGYLSYRDQTRNLIAEAAVTADGERYYYLRLDDNTDNDQPIWSRMTETNFGGVESKFDPSRVLEWTSGGTIIEGQKRVATTSEAVEPQNVKGKILLLTNAIEDPTSNTASGSVTYTYDVKCPISTEFIPINLDFTLNWTAPIPNNPITAVTDLRDGREKVSVTYTNLAGQSSDKPFDGINIVTTRYSDGTTNATKIIK